MISRPRTPVVSKATELEVLLEAEREYRRSEKLLADPVRYSQEKLSVTLWSRQAEIARAVRDERIVAVQSANGIGKTTLAAVLALWWLERFDECIVLLTGSDWNAVENVLCPRIRALASENQLFDDDEILTTQIWLSDRRYLVSRSTNKPEGVQGFHSENLLVICDETSGVEPAIMDALKGNATGSNNRLVFFGNPLSAYGAFYDLCRNGVRHGLPVFSISALEHPNVIHGQEIIKGAVTRESIEEKARDWCRTAEPHDPAAIRLPWNGSCYVPDERFSARVLGCFPEHSADALFPIALLEAAAKPLVNKKPSAIGVDPARSLNGDETVITLCNSEGIVEQIGVRGESFDLVTGRIVSYIREHGITAPVAVDCDGLGWGLHDRLLEAGVSVTPIHNGVAAHDRERFYNLKAELYFRFKEAVEGGYKLPASQRFIQQASAARTAPNPTGKKRIESKEKYRERTGESPDRLESAIYAYYVVAESGTAYIAPAYLPPEPHHSTFTTPIADLPPQQEDEDDRQRPSDWMFG